MSAVFEPTRLRISIDRYQKMVESGVLTKDDRVELIEGEIVDMAPIGRNHFAITARLQDFFASTLGQRAIVAIGAPLNLGDFSEPQPDLALLKRRGDFYRAKLPEADDALLVVEVADSSLAYDLDAKARLYARYGVAEYWVIDVNGRRVIVHRAPEHERFSEVIERRGSDTLSPMAFSDAAVSVRQLFE